MTAKVSTFSVSREEIAGKFSAQSQFI